MKILFVMFDYYPYHSANTLCMESFISKLKDIKYEVHLLTQKLDVNPGAEECDKHIQIFWVKNTHSIYMKYLNRLISIKIQNNIIEKVKNVFLYGILYLLLLEQKIKLLCFGLTSFEKQMVKEIVKLNQINKYNCIITVSAPFSCQLVGAKAAELMNGNCKLVSYTLDPYSYNIALGEKNKNKRLKNEKYSFENSKLIITTNEIYNENRNNELKEYIYKTVPLGYPNLRPIRYERQKAIRFAKEARYIECVFSGVFYLEIRDPSFMLEFLRKAKNKNIRLHLYCKFDNKKLIDVIDEYKQILGECLVIHGYQDKNIVYDALLNTDILINVGNTITNQIPSKIFEYISTGKPIVNFYSNDDDPALGYFNKYPLILNIKQDNINYEEKINRFIKYCFRNKDTTLTFEEATCNMPELISENIINKFEEIIRNI